MKIFVVMLTISSIIAVNKADVNTNAERKSTANIKASPEYTISTTLEIPYLNKGIPCISFGTPTAPLAMLFTHGAGGNLSAPSVVNFAKGFSELKRVLCFEGSMKDLQERTEMYKTVIEHLQWCEVLGGRSLGSRAAILTAQDTENVKALVLVSYPLKTKKGEVRDQLLVDIKEGIDVLFVIGDGDSMCDLNDLRNVTNRMKATTWIIVVKGANHKMEMRSSTATEAVGKMTGRVVAEWLEKRNEQLQNCEIYWDDEHSQAILGDWTSDWTDV